MVPGPASILPPYGLHIQDRFWHSNDFWLMNNIQQTGLFSAHDQKDTRSPSHPSLTEWVCWELDGIEMRMQPSDSERAIWTNVDVSVIKPCGVPSADAAPANKMMDIMMLNGSLNANYCIHQKRMKFIFNSQTSRCINTHQSFLWWGFWNKPDFVCVCVFECVLLCIGKCKKNSTKILFLAFL